MHVLVTGASGLLGSNLCRRLIEDGHTVRALVRQPLNHPLLEGMSVEQCTGDILDPDSLADAVAGCGAVFHAAGYISYLDREAKHCYAVNVDGTRNLLAASIAAEVRRFVHTSSTAAVGIPDDYRRPLDEDAAFDPKYRGVAYMQTKWAGEQLVKQCTEMDTVIVNPSTIFGAGDVKMNTGAMFQRLKSGQLRSLPPGGTACVSVQDCVTGHLLAWKQGQPGRRYILSSANHSLAEVFETAARLLGEPTPTRRVPAWLYPVVYAAMWLHDQTAARLVPATISRQMIMIGFKHRYFSAERAKVELGWRPTQSLKDMFTEAIAFYEKQDLL